MAALFDPATVTDELKARFAAVIARLEAAAPGLESKFGISETAVIVERFTAKPAPVGEAPSVQKVAVASPSTSRSLLNRERRPLPKPKVVTSFGEKHNEGGLSSNPDSEMEQRTEVIIAFDKLSEGKIGEFFQLSAQLGSPITEQADLVRKSYVALRRLLKITPHTREPGPKILKQLLEATELSIRDVLAAGYSEDEDLMIALGGVAEGAKALAWVSLGMCWRSEQKRNPYDYVGGCIEKAKFEWFEGVFEQAKSKPDDEKSALKVKWANTYLDALTELHGYVGKFHKEEMAWGAVKNKSRSMTFWSNALAQTAPGEGTADKYEYSTKLGIPVTKSQ